MIEVDSYYNQCRNDEWNVYEMSFLNESHRREGTLFCVPKTRFVEEKAAFVELI